jgi:hypothetical protein
MGAPPVIPSPPLGSISEDYNYTIPEGNLDLLSNTTKSSLLSVSNMGSAITSKINSTLDLIESISLKTAYLLNGTLLNGLGSGASSTAFSVPNVGASLYVKVVIILGEITPTAFMPSISIFSGATGYQLEIPLTTSEKRLQFNNIAASFVSSFTVRNDTGVSLSSYGNSVMVIPL